MTLRTRRIIFYLFAALFILIGAVSIFYSSGWRFDLETFEINKLGALFLNITPEGATIAIDKNTFDFSPSFLKSGTLIANLFPKTYTVKVMKEGYQPWTKEIQVYPSLVTEVPSVVLLPEKLDLGDPINEEVTNFWIGPKNIIVLKNGRLEFQSHRILGAEVWKWSNSGTAVITKQDGNYFFIDLEKPTSALNLKLVFDNLNKAGDGQILDIDFHPAQDNKFIVLASDGLHILDAQKLTLSLIEAGAVNTFSTQNNELFYEKTGQIFAYNLTIHSNSLLTEQVFDGIRKIQVSPSGYYLSILENSGALYVFDRKSLTASKISENAAYSLFSPNSKKIASVNSNQELTVYPLNEPVEGLKNSWQGPANFRIGSLKKNSISWHANSAYLFIKYPSTLYLLEANNLPPINFQVIDLENSQYQYRASSNTLYLLKGGSLYKLALG